MQRSISHKKSLAPFIYVVLFVLYEGLSSIYLFLPPLLGVLFFLFIQAFRKEDLLAIILVVFSILVFESEKGYLLFTTVIYFALTLKLILPKIEQNFNCKVCVNISIVLLAYIGFYFFTSVLSSIFLLPMPAINYYVIYYIVIEFLIVSAL
ncbi:hypothetical protein FJR48_05860 [Sulfurimonas lithotrophica]|uniref:Uncharacterized protein n=1 Tax=Sulfurimonas lithotrophica TaxID=2590022 RepID=A0A5P8P122_9BACT|nr:hypothetical protein [Sulfurimonas lithotrophica]QFR49277.1 hypothetical protein FJR48_05860 [Sulfurimonas lithotrophica]